MSSEIFNESLEKLKEKFPAEIVKSRPGPKKKLPNGRWVETKFDYIPDSEIRERLDEVFPLSWEWTVLETKIYTVKKLVKKYANGKEISRDLEDVEQVAVLGRLTLTIDDRTDSSGSKTAVSRDSWGGCDLKGGNQPGDSFKIATTNAFKKAAYLFGIGSYIGLEAGREEEEESYSSSSNTQSSNPFSGGQGNSGDANPFS